MVLILSCGAADADGPQTLSLPQALSLALKGNGELRTMKEEQGIYQGERLTASAWPNPLLELEGSSGAPFGTGEDYGVSVGISQEIVTAGKLARRRAVADRSQEAYRWRLADRERLLAEEVTVAYRELQFCSKRLELAGTARDLSRQLFNVATERFNAGDIPELELNLARVELSRSEGRILDVERELLPAQARLANLTGLSSDSEVEVKVEPMTVATSHSLALTDLLHDLDRRPDLRALTATRERGNAEQEAARAERIPNITATVFYRHDEMTFEIDRQQGLNRDNTLGLKLTIPLPLFDRNQGRVQEALARTSRSEREYEAALTTARREVATAHARLKSSEKILALYARDILPQLEENLRLMREAYQLGEVGILSVIEEQRKFLEVHEGYLNDLKGALIATARLEAAAGNNQEPSAGQDRSVGAHGHAPRADSRPPLHSPSINSAGGAP
jgi:cobalt-zinc-cadmium efflux system outer membrane protein